MSLFSTQRRAGYAGLYSAPLVPTICLALYSRDLGPTGVIEMLEWGCIVYPISLVLGSLFGLPILYFLSSIRQVNWWASIIGGFVTGALIAALIGLLSTIQSHTILIYGLQGAGGALVFWLFWIAGPDPTAASARIWTRGFVGDC